ncbi:MAG: signal peptidase I, archaeal type [Candidatus Nanosalina sp. J07AB43]|nr:MAG: signal peptidase I, archaeal type [Candidatus Nanosalina sp. J07AB43]
MVHAFPWIVGADHSFIVLSGSMEPAIPTGSVVFVDNVPTSQVDERIEEGDVITFSQARDIRQTTTHRVVEKKTGDITDSVRFITKGDNNDVRDPEPVVRAEVVGIVLFHIPVLGYIVNMADSTVGWMALVVLPFTLLLMDGMWQLYLASQNEEEE